MIFHDDFPTTEAEFDARFANEDACWEYLVSRRWPEGFACPRCKSTRACLVGGRLFQCSDCRRQTSVTAGTVFHGTHKPLRTWFRAAFYMTALKTGVSAKSLGKLLGLTYKVAWAWTHKLRAAIGERPKEPLQGPVEVDEAFVGGHEPGMPGRSRGKKSVVLVAAENRGLPTGRVRLQAVPSDSADSLTPAVVKNVTAGATVRTDKFWGYKRLTKNDFKHIVEASGRKEASRNFPHVHRVISLLKRVLLGTYQGAVSAGHLQAYLDEFVFRFNRRRTKSPVMIAGSLLALAITTGPRPYRSLVLSKGS